VTKNLAQQNKVISLEHRSSHVLHTFVTYITDFWTQLQSCDNFSLYYWYCSIQYIVYCIPTFRPPCILQNKHTSGTIQ